VVWHDHALIDALILPRNLYVIYTCLALLTRRSTSYLRDLLIHMGNREDTRMKPAHTRVAPKRKEGLVKMRRCKSLAECTKQRLCSPVASANCFPRHWSIGLSIVSHRAEYGVLAHCAFGIGKWDGICTWQARYCRRCLAVSHHP
jgi:hypothetical protein